MIDEFGKLTIHGAMEQHETPTVKAGDEQEMTFHAAKGRAFRCKIKISEVDFHQGVGFWVDEEGNEWPNPSMISIKGTAVSPMTTIDVPVDCDDE